jgi:hypothetical protein
MPTPVTPQEVCLLLEEAGFPMTERRLTDWRARRYLPEVKQTVGSRQGGRGSFYEWPDDEVALQALTLCAMRAIRGRMETAVVMTWFSGFNYPIAFIRPLWAKFEALPWRYALDSAMEGEKLTDADAVETLVTEAAAATLDPRVSPDFKKARARIILDPHYDPSRDLTSGQARQIGRDVLELLSRRPSAKKVSPGSLQPEALPPIRGEYVKVFLALVRDYWSRPRLVELIQAAPSELLLAAHRDVRLLMGLYRRFVTDAIDRALVGDAPGWSLWLAPRVAWQVGRFLLLLDIGLRREGFEKEVDATIAALRSRARQPGVQSLFADALRAARAAMEGYDNSADGQAHLRARMDEFGGVTELQGLVTDAFADLKRIWIPAWARFRQDLAAQERG